MKFLVNLVIHLIILLVIPVNNDEIYAELKRRKANKSAK